MAEAKLHCPKCGATVSAANSYCMRCGAALVLPSAPEPVGGVSVLRDARQYVATMLSAAHTLRQIKNALMAAGWEEAAADLLLRRPGGPSYSSRTRRTTGQPMTGADSTRAPQVRPVTNLHFCVMLMVVAMVLFLIFHWGGLAGASVLAGFAGGILAGFLSGEVWVQYQARSKIAALMKAGGEGEMAILFGVSLSVLAVCSLPLAYGGDPLVALVGGIPLGLLAHHVLLGSARDFDWMLQISLLPALLLGASAYLVLGNGAMLAGSIVGLCRWTLILIAAFWFLPALVGVLMLAFSVVVIAIAGGYVALKERDMLGVPLFLGGMTTVAGSYMVFVAGIWLGHHQSIGLWITVLVAGVATFLGAIAGRRVLHGSNGWSDR